MKRNLFRFWGRRRILAAVLLLVTVASLAGTFLLSTQRASAAWWNGSWLYRRKITLNNSASTEDLDNFPIRVSLSSSNISYARTQDSGQDIRFVDSDDTTQLSHEIETWNELGTSEVWVEVPRINAGSNTDYIWMYYGNVSASDGQDKAGLWSNSYSGIWHMKENPSVTNCSVNKEVCDSASYANNADSNGTMLSSDQVPAIINGGLDFDGVDDNLLVADSDSLDFTQELTISAWVRRSADPGIYETIVIKESAANGANYALQLSGSNLLDFNFVIGGGIYVEDLSNTALTTNTWYYVTATYSNVANQVKLYINGVLDATRTENNNLTPNAQTLSIGASRSTGTEPWPGIIDELQISSAARSDEWVEASYISGNNAMNSFGAEEIFPPDAPVLTSLGDSVAVQPTFQLRASDKSDPTYLRYKIEVCSTSDCLSIVRTIDQTASQTGWSGQDAQAGTAYVASSTAGSSTLASHSYQAPALSTGTQYWWRAYAIDPGGSNAWSEASAISAFITTGPPVAPTLLEPIAVTAPQTPMLRLRTTDPNSDYVNYKIEICSTSNCSNVVRTIDQTSSQTGWASQDTQGATAYSTSTVLANAQLAVHVYQSPALSANTQYWWRAYAIDPGGYNQWSTASSIATFTTVPSQVKIHGGTLINGGTKIGQ